MTARSTWKAAERRIATIFQSYRTPLSGGNSRHTKSDSLHPRIYLEVKLRKKLPQAALWREVKAAASAENKIPVIVLIEKHSRYPIVLCALEDLQAIAKEMMPEGTRDHE